jgi:hypothetical protein
VTIDIRVKTIRLACWWSQRFAHLESKVTNKEPQKLERYYLGVDLADEYYQVWVSDPDGNQVIEKISCD